MKRSVSHRLTSSWAIRTQRYRTLCAKSHRCRLKRKKHIQSSRAWCDKTKGLWWWSPGQQGRVSPGCRRGLTGHGHGTMAKSTWPRNPFFLPSFRSFPFRFLPFRSVPLLPHPSRPFLLPIPSLPSLSFRSLPGLPFPFHSPSSMPSRAHFPKEEREGRSRENLVTAGGGARSGAWSVERGACVRGALLT
jgi:hypothetical protein